MALNIFSGDSVQPLGAVKRQQASSDPKALLDGIAARHQVPANVIVALAEAGGIDSLDKIEALAQEAGLAAKSGKGFDAFLRERGGDALLNRAYDIADQIEPAAAKAPEKPSMVKDAALGAASALTRGLGGAADYLGRTVDRAAEASFGGAYRALTGAKGEITPLESLGATGLAREGLNGIGDSIASGISPEAQQAAQDAMPTGDITDPSTWQAPKDLSLRGLVQVAAQGIGSLAPVVVAGLVSKNPGVAAGVMGGAMAGGDGRQTAGQLIDQLNNEKGPDGLPRLASESDLYQQLVKSGATPEQAYLETKKRAMDTAGDLQALIGGAGGAVTGGLVAKGLPESLAGQSIAGNVARGVVASGIEEGAQEAAETMAARAGVNSAAGTNLNIGEGTLEAAAAGALAGGPFGALGAVPRKGNAPPPEGGANPQPPAPILALPAPYPTPGLPSPTNGGTIIGSGPTSDPASFERQPDDYRSPGAVAQQPAQFRNTGTDGSGAGAAAAPQSPPLDPSAGGGAAATLPPAGPIEAIARLAPDMTPVPEAPAPEPMFPDQKPGAKLRLYDPETDMVLDGVFQREIPGGGAVVRIDGGELELDAQTFDRSLTEAARRDEALKAPKPASGSLSQKALAVVPKEPPRNTEPPQSAEQLAAAISAIEMKAASDGWNPGLMKRRDKMRAQLDALSVDPETGEILPAAKVDANGPQQPANAPIGLPSPADAGTDGAVQPERGAEGAQVPAAGRDAGSERPAGIGAAESLDAAVAPGEPAPALSEGPASRVVGEDPVERARQETQQRLARLAEIEAGLTEQQRATVKRIVDQAEEMDRWAARRGALSAFAGEADPLLQPSSKNDTRAFRAAQKAAAQAVPAQNEAAQSATPTITDIRGNAAVLRGIPKDQPPSVAGVSLRWDDAAEGFIFSRKHRDAVQAAIGVKPPVADSEVQPSPVAGSLGDDPAVKAQEQAAATPAAAQIEAAAAETNPEPTPAQAEAENYKTGKTDWQGLKLSIENKKGGTRRKVGKDGATLWEVTMPAHYGRILGTKGADGDHVDFYMGDNPDSPSAWVIDQVDADTGRFDEHKVMLGFDTPAQAKATYLAGFSDGKGKDRLSGIRKMTTDELTDWLKKGDTTKPVTGKAKPKPLAASAAAQISPEPTPAQAEAEVTPTAPTDQNQVKKNTEPKEQVAEETSQATPADQEPEPSAADAQPTDLGAAVDRIRAAAETRDWWNNRLAPPTRATVLKDMGLFPGDEARIGERKWDAMSSGQQDAIIAATAASRADRAKQRADQEAEKSARSEAARAAREQAAEAQRAADLQASVGRLEDLRGGTARAVVEWGASSRYVAEGGFSGHGKFMLRDGISPDFEALVRAKKGVITDGVADGVGRLAAQAEKARHKIDWRFVRNVQEGRSEKWKPSTVVGKVTKTSVKGAETSWVEVDRLAYHFALKNDLEITAGDDFGIMALRKDGKMVGMLASIRPPNAAPYDEMDRIVSGEMPGLAVPSEEAAPPADTEKAPTTEAEAADVGETEAPDPAPRAPEPAARPAKIEDFGEKIGGARKDVWSGFKEKMEEAVGLDVAAEPLSKSWPEPDYEKLIEAGVDPWTVAFVRAARDMIPRKPGKSWKLRGWADEVRTLRKFASDLLSGRFTKDQLQEKLAETPRLNDKLGGRVALYEAVGHAKSLKDLSFGQHTYSMLNGEYFTKGKTFWEVTKEQAATAFNNMPKTLIRADTREEAVAMFKQAYGSLDASGTPKGNKGKGTKFLIYSQRGDTGAKYRIGVKIGANHIDLRTGIADVAEARRIVSEEADQLQAQLDRMRDIPNERRDENAPRLGVDHRSGADVTPQQFAEAFGFRGVEFGNWVEDARRQEDLNNAYDGLMDLASILDLPPKAISLNGTLGLAFGARGSGGKNPAAAHFEPGKVVINLTKRSGRGSLAHEWFHAMDNHFARKRDRIGGSFITDNLAPGTSPINAGVRPEVIEAFRAVKRAIMATDLKKRSENIDRLRTSAYWGTGIEMHARAFESYVIAKLQDQGAANDYLANVVNGVAWGMMAELSGLGDSYPYLTEAEIEKVRPAFDNLFRTIETRETERGVEMYMRAPSREPIATLTGNELGEWEDLRQLGKKVEAWYRNNLIGKTVVNEASGLKISFVGAGAKKVSGRKGDVLYRAVPALREILQKGTITSVSPDSRGRQHIKAWHTISAAVVIDGKPRDLVAQVMETADGNFHYDLSRDMSDGARFMRQGADAAITEGRYGLEDNPAELNLQFAEPSIKPVEVASFPALSQVLAREMRTHGLAGKISPRVVRGLVSAAGIPILGRQRGPQIEVNADAPDAVGVMRHEIIHALRDPSIWGADYGLFTQAEWQALVKAARADAAISERVERDYADKSAAVRTEEKVAELYREWAGARDGAGQLGRIFAKVRALFRAMASGLRGEGFTDAALVMDRIASGKIGGRGPQGPGGGRRADMEKAAASTESPEFKRWFGDSVVTDADGKPLVVYHGTNADFEAFDPARRGAATGAQSATMGFFFASDPEVASSYADTFNAYKDTKIGRVLTRLFGDMYAVWNEALLRFFKRPSAIVSGGNVMPVYLSIKNPMVFDFKGGEYRERTYADLIEEAKEKGHDGVVLRNTIDEGFNDGGDAVTDVYVAFSPTQAKSVFNRGTWNPDDPRMSEMRLPMTLRDVMIAGELGSITSHPEYSAAKAGDIQAAVRLARDIVTDDLVDQVRKAIGEDRPSIVPIVSEEATGRNKIPQAAAEVLALRLGLVADVRIVQSNAPRRTGLSGLDRIFAAPEFDGPVEMGQDYLLVDDTLTQGATFAALASHIEANGGRIIGAVALTGKQYSATLSLSPDTLSALREKHGSLEQDFIAATGYGFDSLTESEARYLTNFKPADAFRDRVAAERSLRGSSQDQGSSSEIDDGAEMRASLMQTAAKAQGMIGSAHWKDPGVWVSNAVSNLLTDSMGAGSNWSSLALVPGRALFAELGKRLPSAQRFLKAKDAMDALRNDWQAKSAEVMEAWYDAGSKNHPAREQLHDLMHRTTIAGVDPSKPDTWRHALQTAAERDVSQKGYDGAQDWARDVMDQVAARKRTHKEFKAIFDTLPKEFQDIFVKARNTLNDLADDMDRAVLENVEQSIKLSIKRAQREHAKALEEIRDQGLKGAERDEAIAAADAKLLEAKKMGGFAAKAKMASLRKVFESNRLKGPYFPLARFGNYFVTVRNADGEVISFARFERAKQQEAHIKEMEALHPGRVKFGVLDQKGGLRGQVDPRFVADVEKLLMQAGADTEVMDAVWQRYLETLPDMSVRKSKIHRKGREGFYKDALRAFASHTMHGAHQLARLKHGLDLEDALDDAFDEAAKAEDPNRAKAVVNEMQRRKDWIMNPTNAAWSSKASSLAFVWYLGVSPAAALINLSQTTVIGPAVMKAKFQRASVTGIVSEIARATKEFGQGQGVSWKDTWSAENAASLNDDERAALREGYKRGTIDKTQAHDLAAVAESGVEFSPFREKWMKRIGWAFHHAERVNREVTMLAAYRLARRDGLGHDAAIEAAIDVTWRTHFSYQNSDRPRFMQDDYMKVLTQFRQYSVNLLFRLFRDAHQSLYGATKEDRAEARTQLIGISLSMFAHAGIKGVWGYGLLMMLLGMFFPGGDDDAEKWLQDALLVEGDSAGTAAWNWTMGAALNGVPGRVLGVDLSERIGMPNLWFRGDDRDLEGEDLVQGYVNEILGPTVGILFSLGRAGQNLVDGEVARGIEGAVPKFMRDILRTGRYAAEGVRTKNGDTIVEDISPLEMLWQANGFTPARIAERYEVNSRLKNAEQRIMDERKEILQAWDEAQRSGEGIPPELNEALNDFNKRYPYYPITADSIRQSIRSRQLARDNNEFGVRLNPKLNSALRESEPPTIFQ